MESKTGQWTLASELPPARLIDLPGLYSLDPTSLDEEIARDILLGRAESIATPDVIVVVVDATNLVRNLYLAFPIARNGTADRGGADHVRLGRAQQTED